MTDDVRRPNPSVQFDVHSKGRRRQPVAVHRASKVERTGLGNQLRPRWRERRAVASKLGRAGAGRLPPPNGKTVCCERHAEDGLERLIGSTKGGMNTKLHAITDANGRPLGFFMTAG